MIKTNKRLSYILVALILVMVVIAGNNAITSGGKKEKEKEEKITVFLNNETLNFSTNPIVKEGKVYVPVEELSQNLDVKVKIKRSKKITIEKGNKNLVINTKDNTVITQDNETFFIDSIKEDKKIFLPIDVISKHFGYEVSDLSNDTINIYSVDDSDIKDTQNDVAMNDVNLNSTNEENHQVDIDKKIAYLTFDDGPNANTDQILDVLKEKNVKATFFMLGSSIMAHEDTTKRISDEGHGLGVHSMTHNFNSVYASPDSFMHEMTGANDALYNATGRQTFLLRAPYGSKPYMKQEFRDVATSWGYRIWDWNIDSRDSIKKNTTADEVYNEVANQIIGVNKAVILFHDKEHTLEALPRIIDFLIQEGYEIRELDTNLTPLNFWNDFR